MTIKLPSDVSGYATSDDYFAQHSQQGGRVHYSIVLPLAQVPVTLPVPDPEQSFEDNRQVRLTHANGFAAYIRNNAGWHAGPITVRGLSSELTFTEFENQTARPVKLGILSVPRNMRSAFRIIDGQHRILGVKLLFDGLTSDILEATSRLANARRSEGSNPSPDGRALVTQLERDLKKLHDVKERIDQDTMTIDLVVVDDDVTHKQIFIDVANNALSVQKAVTVRFDMKKAVNRAVVDLITSDNTDILIKNRIDEQADRMTGNNPKFIGSGTLAEIVRSLRKGITGRFSAQDEESIDHVSLVRETNEFFELLRDAFKPLADIAQDKVRPAEYRKKHLVMSATMVRILAATHYELKQGGAGRSEITEYFRAIDRTGGTPLTSNTAVGKMWINSSNGAFVEGENAPGSRTQAKKDVVAQLVAWFTNPPKELGWKGGR